MAEDNAEIIVRRYFELFQDIRLSGYERLELEVAAVLGMRGAVAPDELVKKVRKNKGPSGDRKGTFNPEEYAMGLSLAQINNPFDTRLATSEFVSRLLSASDMDEVQRLQRDVARGSLSGPNKSSALLQLQRFWESGAAYCTEGRKKGSKLYLLSPTGREIYDKALEVFSRHLQTSR